LGPRSCTRIFSTNPLSMAVVSASKLSYLSTRAIKTASSYHATTAQESSIL
jgi:hypothetical protein